MERDKAQARVKELTEQHTKNPRTTTKETRHEAMMLCSDYGLEVPKWVRHWVGPF
jgi:hypothetical protein